MNLIPTIGISAHALGMSNISAGTVFVQYGPCDDCGRWGRIGTWDDTICECCE